MENDNLFLVYINPIGKDSNNLFEYEFFFSETPELVWGEDWNIACPAACSNTLPDPTTYSETKTIKTDISLFCAQQNTCFSLQDCIDGIISLAYCVEDDIIFSFKFGETHENVVKVLNEYNIIFG